MPHVTAAYCRSTRESTLGSIEMSSTIAMPRGAQNQGNGTTSATPWVYRPWLDLLIGCGAWSAPLLVLTNYVSRGSATGWSFAFYLLALLFNYPHFMATVYRAYHSYDEFRKYRTFTLPVASL